MKKITQAALLLLALVLLAAPVFHAQAEEEADFDLCVYAETLFGFESMAYYPYLPTHIDPVSYDGGIALDVGLKGDQLYAVYHSWQEDDLSHYLDYLAYFGYAVTPVDCALPSVSAWRAAGPGTASEGRPLLQELEIYHVSERQLLAVAYPYLDAWILDAWIDQPDWIIGDPFKLSKLPCTLQLAEDTVITVEEFALTKKLNVYGQKDLSFAPYVDSALKGRGFKARALNTVNPDTALHFFEVDKYPSSRFMMCVRISFDEASRSKILSSLRVAAADTSMSEYADVISLPMLQMNSLEPEKFLFSAAAPTASDLWLLFPPYAYEAGDYQRLYFCLQEEDDPWIGDLRDWTYMDFKLSSTDIPEE